MAQPLINASVIYSATSLTMEEEEEEEVEEALKVMRLVRRWKNKLPR